MVNRRAVLGAAAALIACRGLRARPQVANEAARVMTVRGPIAAEDLGLTLPHEHILVEFIGADRVSPARYRAEEVIQAALAHIERIRALGVRTLVECTPAYLGRDSRLLKVLSERTGIQILTNTGYYGASKEKFLPEHARTETADQLAARWLVEWRDGIGDSGIRPGFIKIGVDEGPLTAVQRKLVQAAARTYRICGLTIAAHTGDGRAAVEELAILKDEGVSPSAFIWVHAQNERDPNTHVKVARQGAWVELDGISADSIDDNLQRLTFFKDQKILDQVLLSHDAGWYHVGKPGGGEFRPFDSLVARLLPALTAHGFTSQEIHRLTVDNPREALSIRVRTAGQSTSS